MTTTMAMMMMDKFPLLWRKDCPGTARTCNTIYLILPGTDVSWLPVQSYETAS